MNEECLLLLPSPGSLDCPGGSADAEEEANIQKAHGKEAYPKVWLTHRLGNQLHNNEVGRLPQGPEKIRGPQHNLEVRHGVHQPQTSISKFKVAQWARPAVQPPAGGTGSTKPVLVKHRHGKQQ